MRCNALYLQSNMEQIFSHFHRSSIGKTIVYLIAYKEWQRYIFFVGDKYLFLRNKGVCLAGDVIKSIEAGILNCAHFTNCIPPTLFLKHFLSMSNFISFILYF